MRKEFSCVVFLIVVLQLTFIRAQGYSGSQIVIPLLTNPVTMDGQWTSANEWSDAIKITLINCSCSSATANGYLYAKHDPSAFYFLIDSPSSTVLDANNDGMSVMLDPAHNGGSTPQSDDREFVAYPSGNSMSVGTGAPQWTLNNPLPQGVKATFTMGSSGNSAQPHEISEFLIPYSTFSGLQNTIRFSAVARHGTVGSSGFSLALWPADRARENPSTWGEVTASNSPIPEFSNVWVITAVTLLVSLTLVGSRRRGHH